MSVSPWTMSRIAIQRPSTNAPMPRSSPPPSVRPGRSHARAFEDPAWGEGWDLAFADLYLEAHAHRLAELDVLSAPKIGDLRAGHPVLLGLAVTGFGVMLPPGA